MADVFISYSRRDYFDENFNIKKGCAIDNIITAFNDAGINYWFDINGINHVEEFAGKIVTEIKKAKIFLFISSATSNRQSTNSDINWTYKELACAHDDFHKKILPIKIDDADFHPDIWLRLAGVNRVDYYKYRNTNDAINTIMQTVNEILHINDILQITFNPRENGYVEQTNKSTITIQKGKSLNKTQIPKVYAKEGYKFIGWDKNPLSSKLHTDCIFTAQYAKIQPISVHFDPSPHGDIIGKNIIIIEKGEILNNTQIPKIKTHKGYRFTGWDKSVDSPINEDTTLYAQYKKINIPIIIVSICLLLCILSLFIYILKILPNPPQENTTPEILLNNNTSSKEVPKEDTLQKNIASYIYDCQGNKYPVVRIGSQVWMAENLKCTKYDTQSEASGQILSISEKNTFSPYYQYSSGYNRYNWAAAVGIMSGDKAEIRSKPFKQPRQGICPNGWHIPSKDEWYSLKKYVMENIQNDTDKVGKHLRGTSLWDSPGFDSFGFNAEPVGWLTLDGSNVLVAVFWSASISYKRVDSAFYAQISSYNEELSVTDGFNKAGAMPVRCVKNTTEL